MKINNRKIKVNTQFEYETSNALLNENMLMK